jgi:LPXTG-site transpeptidase (sortase) family protein
VIASNFLRYFMQGKAFKNTIRNMGTIRNVKINLKSLAFKLEDYISIVSALLLSVVVILIGFFRINIQVVNNLEANGVNSRSNQTGMIKAVEASQASPNKINYQTIDNNQDPNFTLIIPKINLRQKVFENVDPGVEQAYKPVLEQGIAHGKFTRLPDEATSQGNVYLFAHRNGYIGGQDIGFFRRVGELEHGDVAIISYLGKIYTYRFKGKFVISPQDTWVYSPRADQPTLTLQTCEDNETKRLIVKFTLVSVQ